MILDEPWDTPLDATSEYVITKGQFTVRSLNDSLAAFDLGLKDLGVRQDVDGSPGSVISLEVKGFEALLGFLPYRAVDDSAKPTSLSGSYTIDVGEPGGNGHLSTIELWDGAGIGFRRW